MKSKFPLKYSCDRGEKSFQFVGNEENPLRFSSIRTWYMHDIDQIVYSNAFRKLQRKTQLLDIYDPRMRTRLIHTLEVIRIACELANNLGANIRLTEAIALGHDLGNSPFGYIGNTVLYQKAGYKHEEGSICMIKTLSMRRAANPGEEGGRIKAGKAFIRDKESGIRYDIGYEGKDPRQFPVTPEVIDGVLNHNNDKARKWKSLESQIVKVADNFAYIIQDIDDALKTHILDEHELRSYAEKPTIFGRKWSIVNQNLKVYGDANLKDLFDTNRGNRLAAMIQRTIFYNYHLFKTKKLKHIKTRWTRSRKIPILRLDPQLNFVINGIWTNIIEKKIHSHPIVKKTGETHKNKICLLYDLLVNKVTSKSCRDFNEFMQNHRKSSRFAGRSHHWLIAYFICHLTADEVNNIISEILSSKNGRREIVEPRFRDI